MLFFFVRIKGSVPIRLVSFTHRSSAVLYVLLVDFSTEDRFIAWAPCIRAMWYKLPRDGSIPLVRRAVLTFSRSVKLDAAMLRRLGR